MKGKNVFSVIEHTILCAVTIMLGMSIGACSKETPKVDPPQPKKEIPATISECVQTDIETLRAIAKDNPQAHLFEGENPEQWKGVVLTWVKDKDGKYAVSEFRLKEDATVTDFVLKLDGSKERRFRSSNREGPDDSSRSTSPTPTAPRSERSHTSGSRESAYAKSSTGSLNSRVVTIRCASLTPIAYPVNRNF